jgi:hypothetical protein
MSAKTRREKWLTFTLAACVSKADSDAFKRLASSHKVSVSSYLRGIIVDALADETTESREGKGS